MTRVLIVDDSNTMRQLIRRALSRHPSIEVVGEAEHPLIARQAIKDLNPDVITLDIEMPEMSGLAFLEKIMQLRPMPVIIVSTLTRRHAKETITALSLGAFDCIEKPSASDPDAFSDLPERVLLAAKAKGKLGAAHRLPARSADSLPRVQSAVSHAKVVAIGASTGGVEALHAIFNDFSADCPPTIVVQHMPPSFTSMLAERLNRQCVPTICEVADGMRLQRGTIYIAPGGGRHCEIVDRGGLVCTLREGGRVNNHCPSVDVMFRSVARTCGSGAVGVVLTGMGSDGAEGLKEMRKAGAKTMAQDEATSVVYGMPRVAWEIGGAERQLPLHLIAKEVLAGAWPTPKAERLARS